MRADGGAVDEFWKPMAVMVMTDDAQNERPSFKAMNQFMRQTTRLASLTAATQSEQILKSGAIKNYGTEIEVRLDDCAKSARRRPPT